LDRRTWHIPRIIRLQQRDDINGSGVLVKVRSLVCAAEQARYRSSVLRRHCLTVFRARSSRVFQAMVSNYDWSS
jgi:hypothetical protein